MNLAESKCFILQNEIIQTKEEQFKFNDNEESALNKILGKNNGAASAAFCLVKTAGENYEFGVLELPL